MARHGTGVLVERMEFEGKNSWRYVARPERRKRHYRSVIDRVINNQKANPVNLRARVLWVCTAGLGIGGPNSSRVAGIAGNLVARSRRGYMPFDLPGGSGAAPNTQRERGLGLGRGRDSWYILRPMLMMDSSIHTGPGVYVEQQYRCRYLSTLVHALVSPKTFRG